MIVKTDLSDGSKATLQKIIQDNNYRGGYLKMPEDPVWETPDRSNRQLEMEEPPMQELSPAQVQTYG